MSDAGTQLDELLSEQAIRKVVQRYARGIDRLDYELVRDCYWPDATDVHGPFTGRRDEFVDWLKKLLPRHTMTMHCISGVLVEQRGDVAGVESYGVAYHSGEPAGDIRWNYAGGFRYVDRFERRDGQWRIADRVTAIEWVTPWARDDARVGALGSLARRSTADPVYAFDLNG